MTTAARLRLRLFIEGIEIPVIAVQVQVAPNSPSVCVIQIPPAAEGTRLKPRSVVHVFFLDLYEVHSPLISDRSRNPNQNDPTAYQQSISKPLPTDSNGNREFNSDNFVADTTNEQYKLLFVGELFGFQWTKSSSNKSLVLQCQDLSNYWDYAYQWNNTDLFGPGIKALFSGGSTNLFTDFLDDEGSVIARIVQTPSVQYPELKGLLGGIVHLCEAIGGSYYTQKTFAGQNIFFSLAELRLHIIQLITAYPNDPTSQNLFNAHGYGSLLGRTLGNLGQQVSIRQAINALMGVIFHETYAQPCPLYVPGTKGTISGTQRIKIADDPVNGYIASTAVGLIQSIELLKVDLQSTTALKQILLSRVNGAKLLCQQTAQRVKATGVTQAISLYGAAQAALGIAGTKIQAKWNPGATATVVSDITQQLQSAEDQLQKASQLEINTTAQKKGIPARLQQQIFRPDVWFSAPPRCNVLFPEHYTQMSYSRSFMQEPTRLLLKTNDEFFGEDELFDSYYFAPKTTSSLKRSTVGKGKNAKKKADVTLFDLLSNDILEHELYTGIIPVFEKMGELNIFAARSGTVNGKVPKIGLAQKSANFLYFKYRFAARQMQVEGRFNPYVAVGFPGLIIDKYVDVETLKRYNQLVAQTGRPTRELNQMLGTNFLGNFTEVQHIVDQRNGRTTFNCSYPRQPEESVEFLGSTKGNITEVPSGTQLVQTDVAAFSPPRVGGLGPNKGVIQTVTDVTQAYKGQTLPIYGSTLTNIDTQQVLIGVTQAASAFGTDTIALAGSPDILITFKAYAIIEENAAYSPTSADDSMEELVRPGWYGDIWHPAKIGEAYNFFFQTGAITDTQQITSNNSSVSPANSAANDAFATAASTGTDSSSPLTDAPAVFALATNSSVEAAVAFLQTTYSYIKHGQLDVEGFIQSYSWRPIATLVDLFGTTDLTLSPDGATVLKGVEGFHSRAFGPFENLFGLVTSDIESIVGIKKGSTIAQKGDTRKAKQDAVKALIAALQFSRAVLG